MKLSSNFKITAPATIANLSCGIDILGLALNIPQDEIIVTVSESPGIHISSIINNKAKIPLDTNKNAAGVSAQLLLDFLIKEYGLDANIGLDFKLIKKVPIGYGLGSSSASAVAGAFAVNDAFGEPLSKRELVRFALEGELIVGHKKRINSIVPALIGGLTLTRDHDSFDFHRLPFPKGMQLVIMYPFHRSSSKRENNEHLGHKIAIQNATQQSANISSLVHALYMSDLDLIARSLVDNIAEKHWSAYIPFFDKIKNIALDQHALACGIASSGSGIFALCKNNIEASNVSAAMSNFYKKNKINHDFFIAQINNEGVTRA